MSIRTTVDIPEPLYTILRHRAEHSGASIRSLVLRALEQAYAHSPKSGRLTAPPLQGEGQLGPDFPEEENPHEFVFS